MTEYTIEVAMQSTRTWTRDDANYLANWGVFNTADSIEKARRMASKAMLKTKYLAVRIIKTA